MACHNSVTLAMKIAAGLPQTSALDVWLREAEIAEANNPTAGPASHAAATLKSNSAPASRDAAEGLLDLNVWDGPSRTLIASASSARNTGSDTAVQGWTEHIFAPLL